MKIDVAALAGRKAAVLVGALLRHPQFQAGGKHGFVG